jgi:hypothetical protein
MAPETLLG